MHRDNLPITVYFLLTGLEAQLLGIVVRKERPELEEQKDNLVRSIAAGKKKLNECEDEILRLVVNDCSLVYVLVWFCYYLMIQPPKYIEYMYILAII